MKNSILKIIKNEKVTVIALILAVVSMFFVHPDADYLNYINVKTIITLFILMLIVAILRAINLFYILGQKLVKRADDMRKLVYTFIFLNFFLSMFITNDVALLTFIPFTIDVLIMTNKMSYIIPIIVLETISANLGSSMTPIGNPQNIYLFDMAYISLYEFMKLMLPYAIISIILFIIIINFLFKKEKISVNTKEESINFKNINFNVFKNVDFYLLLTFIFLFIFIGNISRISYLSDMLKRLITNHEVSVSIIVSQVISNVPAAILLSKFTNNIKALIIGTNLGGLGTIIASMASLISYKFYVKLEKAKVSEYLKEFTIYNILFLMILIVFGKVIHSF